MTQAFNLSQLANNLNSTGQLDATDGLVNAVPAPNGGTGQASYAVGDLLFANTTTSLSRLADAATGNAVISGGVGVAPAYGKIGLTTHVSGTLPVANGGIGVGTLGLNNVILGNGTGAVQSVAPGTSGNVLTSNGTTWASADAPSPNGAFRSVQTFTVSGTYTRPAGLVRAKITVVGGGGGGGAGAAGLGAGTSAGGGGGAIRVVNAATLGASQTVTIGAGGTGGASGSGNPGVAGGTTSIGSLLSATGGGGGGGAGSGVGGNGGIGSFGDLNIGGGRGGGAWAGGSSMLGGGGGKNIGGDAGRSYGGGGSATETEGDEGGAGAAGVVFVEEFF